MGANSIPTDATLDLDEQISQLMQCKPLSEQQVPPILFLYRFLVVWIGFVLEIFVGNEKGFRFLAWVWDYPNWWLISRRMCILSHSRQFCGSKKKRTLSYHFKIGDSLALCSPLYCGFAWLTSKLSFWIGG